MRILQIESYSNFQIRPIARARCLTDAHIHVAIDRRQEREKHNPENALLKSDYLRSQVLNFCQVHVLQRVEYWARLRVAQLNYLIALSI